MVSPPTQISTSPLVYQSASSTSMVVSAGAAYSTMRAMPPAASAPGGLPRAIQSSESSGQSSDKVTLASLLVGSSGCAGDEDSVGTVSSRGTTMFVPAGSTHVRSSARVE